MVGQGSPGSLPGVVSLAARAPRRQNRAVAGRDEFSQTTIRKLGDRVGWLCSNPACRSPTKGPHTVEGRAVSVGKASHIHAAAPGGKRYDPDQTREQRRSTSNGIWLCGTCATLIDTDEKRWPPGLLRSWRAQAELAALDALAKGGASNVTEDSADEPEEHDHDRVLIRSGEHYLWTYELDAGDTMVAGIDSDVAVTVTIGRESDYRRWLNGEETEVLDDAEDVLETAFEVEAPADNRYVVWVANQEDEDADVDVHIAVWSAEDNDEDDDDDEYARCAFAHLAGE